MNNGLHVFLVNYQQFKYTDRSDNPPLRTWKIVASDADSAFRLAQIRAVEEIQKGRKLGGVRRVMQTESGDLVTSDAGYIDEYVKLVIQ